MALLWPERDATNARRLLNLAVHVLRSALGEASIASTTDGLLLNPSAVRCDLQELRTAIASGAFARIAQLYSGPLLHGFHLDESSEFGYWLDGLRDELAHAHSGALLQLAEQQERSGDVHGRVGTCRRLVAADPYSGVYAQALMRALDAAGDRAAAIHHAAEHARRLRVDLDLEPDPDVVGLARSLRDDVRRPISSPSRPGAATVAVLPFVSIGADQEGEAEDFADGITEDVIAHLSKIRALTVISRASVLPFKRRQHTMKEVGTRLGVATVLDGSVRHVGDRVRIVATLVDAETNVDLWAETYDRQLTDIFQIQTDVALHIAQALKAQLTRDEQARVEREPTKDIKAYRLFLQGRQSYIKFTKESLFKAIELFDRAIACDPTFALAHAYVAMSYLELAESGNAPPDVAKPRASEATSLALRLDPELGAAHCTAGYLKTVQAYDWAGAERDFKRALELSPSSADTYDLYGRLCSALGRFDDAIPLLRRAQQLDPLAHRLDIVTTLIRAGHYDEAIARGEDAVELDGADDRAIATLGWAYFLSGRRQEGLQTLERAVDLVPHDTMWLGQLGGAYGMAGNDARAREILHQLEERSQSTYVSPYHFAYVYAGLGEAERALDHLERAVEERAGPSSGIKGSFVLAPLRGHPRFQALLTRMRLE